MSYVSATAGYNLKQLETPTAKSRLQYISMIHKRKTPQSGVLRRHSFVELTIARTHNLDTSKLLNKVNKKINTKKSQTALNYISNSIILPPLGCVASTPNSSRSL